MYQYLFAGQNVWSGERLAQLQALKSIAFKVIDFISQFEDELVKIWNKPKFVRNSHYMLTLDIVLTTRDLLERSFAHPGMPAQLEEWRALGMLGRRHFQPGSCCGRRTCWASRCTRTTSTCPLDTRHFPDLELDILALFDDLDAALDGWLVHSENYQALNTLLFKVSRESKSNLY